MADPRPRLIAIDGSDGRAVSEAAVALQRELADRQITSGVSHWDASGLFNDVHAAPTAHRDLSPRTLLLLYAADLAFRLRWEIEPALERGAIVIAAPYISTAVTFGLASGLSREWLLTLLRFAPVPARTAVLREGKRHQPWKRRSDRGFGECCTTLLEDTPEGFARRKTRGRMIGALSTAAEKHGGQYRLKDLTDLADEITRKQPARPAQRDDAE